MEHLDAVLGINSVFFIIMGLIRMTEWDTRYYKIKGSFITFFGVFLLSLSVLWYTP